MRNIIQAGILVLTVLATASASVPVIPTITGEQAEAWDREIRASGAKYILETSPPDYVIPNSTFPDGVDLELSNNCVGIGSYQDVLFIGFRSAPYHFASDQTRIFLLSSEDGGKSWSLEKKIQLGSDAREPHFLLMPDGTFVFSFFQAGTNALAFEPVTPMRMYYHGRGNWSEPEVWGKPHEVVWQLGTFNGTAYASSYEGSHYAMTNRPDVFLFFNQSTDGHEWTPLNKPVPGPNGTEEGGYTYRGGASEVGFEFTLDGELWAVLRNEDGDDSGWGSRIIRAKADSLGEWELFPKEKSDPNIYESPRMFRHGDELFLVARRDHTGVYWDHSLDYLPWELQHNYILGAYSTRAHKTSVWRLNRGDPENGIEPKLELLLDIPGCGDTAFPSIIRIGKHTYLVANYTSPTDLCADWPWIKGQVHPKGTSIYFTTFTFVPQGAVTA